ncbi:MAG: hypothetical protein IJD70_09595 [Clostridia bacterium]|nr:hypothetical protein [Clostridia bacterium]
MKKCRMDEAAMRAFRTYARLGLCGSESALGIICRIRGICRDPAALDMLAVFDTMRLLELSGDDIALRAVEEVYFFAASRRLRANEITLRVRRLADELHCDDRTVYRHLKKARDIWHTLRAKEKKQTAGERSLLNSMIGKIT